MRAPRMGGDDGKAVLAEARQQRADAFRVFRDAERRLTHARLEFYRAQRDYRDALVKGRATSDATSRLLLVTCGDMLWTHELLLRLTDEVDARDARTLGQQVWIGYSPRSAASCVTPRLTELERWGWAARLDDRRPALWLRTAEGTAALLTVGAEWAARGQDL